MKIALGTVQFGLDYGLSNPNGKVSPEEVSAIIQLAAERGVKLLDTAQGYGTSELVLGSVLGECAGKFQVVTKTASLEGRSVAEVVSAYESSLQKLKVTCAYGLLVHSAQDLIGPAGKELYAALGELKQLGKVKKIGVSVYDASQIDSILPDFPLDIIQLPLNILDQRLARSGHLETLKKAGVEIHVRSVFLQGLLLMPLDQVSPYFSSILPKLRHYEAELKAANLSRLEGALLYLRGVSQADHAILGVCSRDQLREILDAYDRLPAVSPIDFSRFSIADSNILNPARWQL